MVSKLRLSAPILCFILGGQLLHAQQHMMTNDSVLKLASAGLNEDLILQTIEASPGHYDTTPVDIVALRKAGLTAREISAMATKAVSASTPFRTPQAFAESALTDPTARPRIFLQAESHGNTFKSHRDQSIEMSKDFEKNCPAVRISINPSMADYTVLLNHIESGFAHDNQIEIADRNGDLISAARDGGTISGDTKRACAAIVANWAKRQSSASPAPQASDVAPSREPLN